VVLDGEGFGMTIVVVYDNQSDVPSSSVGSEISRCEVDDILRRLGNVEKSVWDLRAQVGAVAVTIQHLATAASVSELRAEFIGRAGTD
jgi:hypothetical protein